LGKTGRAKASKTLIPSGVSQKTYSSTNTGGGSRECTDKLLIGKSEGKEGKGWGTYARSQLGEAPCGVQKVGERVGKGKIWE